MLVSIVKLTLSCHYIIYCLGSLVGPTFWNRFGISCIRGFSPVRSATTREGSSTHLSSWLANSTAGRASLLYGTAWGRRCSRWSVALRARAQPERFIFTSGRCIGYVSTCGQIANNISLYIYIYIYRHVLEELGQAKAGH